MKNSAVVRPVVLPANLGLSIAAKNLLCLLYLPSSSVRSGDVISNRTMNQIIKPIIGSDVFIVQLLFAGYHANTVDFPLMCTICQDPTHFIVTNYVNRVKTVLQIRRHLQAECVGWIGGLDAAAALSKLITNEFRILPDNGIEDLYTGNLGYLLVSIHHPSRPLMAGGGDPTAAKLIRRSLELFQIVLKFAHENIPFTLENIEVACNSNLLAHRKMYNETKRMLIFILGPSLMNQVVNTKRGLLHNDSKPLLAALDFVSNTEYFFSIDDQDQRILLARLALRPWIDLDVEFAMTIPPANIKDYLRDKLRLSMDAQQLLPYTADSLVESGHSSSILRGSAGAFKAQQTLLATSSALVRTGFTRSEVDALLMGNNGSAKGQQVIFSTFDFLWVLQSSNC